MEDSLQTKIARAKITTKDYSLLVTELVVEKLRNIPSLAPLGHETPKHQVRFMLHAFVTDDLSTLDLEGTEFSRADIIDLTSGENHVFSQGFINYASNGQLKMSGTHFK